MNAPSNAPGQRDAATLRILGWFFVALGALVLVGSLWTLGNPRALVVNLGSGLALGGVGAATVLASRRIARSADAKNSA